MDEIYENVEDVEPWMSGNARGPSTAFSLLHRLLTLRLDSQQVKALLNHRDSPYIRAVRPPPWRQPRCAGHAGHACVRACAMHHRRLRRPPCLPPAQVGFLFLRYVADPKTLWAWISPYVGDREVSARAWPCSPARPRACRPAVRGSPPGAPRVQPAPAAAGPARP